MLSILFISLLSSAWVVHSTPPPDGCDCRDTKESCVTGNWGTSCDHPNVGERIQGMCPKTCGLCDRPTDCGPQFCDELQCQNGGVFNKRMCSCDCNDYDHGDVCQHRCFVLVCDNGGVFNRETCQCDCTEPYYGTFCSIRCIPGTCLNGGVFNSSTCTCDCRDDTFGQICQTKCADACVDNPHDDKPETCEYAWSSKSCWSAASELYQEMCPYTCGVCSKPDQCRCVAPKQCENGGVWKVEGCKCECPKGTFGPLCEGTCDCSDAFFCDGSIKGCVNLEIAFNKYKFAFDANDKSRKICKKTCGYCSNIYPKSCGYPEYNPKKFYLNALELHGTAGERAEFNKYRWFP